MLSKRIQSIEASGIRKIFDLAMRNKGEYVNLSIGQPHFKTSEKLKSLAKCAIDDNCNAYMPTSGLDALRGKIAKKLKTENNIDAKPEEIIVSAGVSGALFLLLSSVIDEGDEVIVPDPYFVMYKQVLNFFGAKIVYLDTYPTFRIDPDKLERLITPRTKAVLVNSPCNPTGVVLSKDELEKIAQVAQKHGLLVISDEIYEKFDFEKKFFSVASIYPKTVTLNGYSKSHAIPGWRMGYAHGPAEIIEAMNKLQQYTFVCAPSFAQAALAGEDDNDLSILHEDYARKRDMVYEGLKDHYELNRPEGAFYAFIKNPKGKDNFVDEIIENKLLVVPGNVFSQRGDYFRISFAAEDDQIQKGVEILRGLVR